MTNLDILIDKINEIKLNIKYKEDLNIINQIYIELIEIKNNKLSEEVINNTEDNILYLVNKYIELDDLENLYDDIKFIMRKKIHENNVAKLREKMRNDDL
jgi:ATP-dependent Lon protease